MAKDKLKRLKREGSPNKVVAKKPPQKSDNLSKGLPREEIPQWEDDPLVDKMVIIFLVAFLLFVIFVPTHWILNVSMWWNGIS